MIHKRPPDNFKPMYEIVSCFVENDAEFLLLHRHTNKSEGDLWGVPAGKIEIDERPIDAMVRELAEETGINAKASQLSFFDKVYVRYPSGKDFVYIMYHMSLEKRPYIRLSTKEHKDFKWVSPNTCLNMSLVTDLDACVNMFYSIGV